MPVGGLRGGEGGLAYRAVELADRGPAVGVGELHLVGSEEALEHVVHGSGSFQVGSDVKKRMG
ncbi:hypothetical protein GCM10009630_43570 [Kribbella jejuensis]